MAEETSDYWTWCFPLRFIPFGFILQWDLFLSSRPLEWKMDTLAFTIPPMHTYFCKLGEQIAYPDPLV